MAHVLADRVMEVTSTTSSGTYTLAGAVSGYRAFASALRPDGTSITTNDTMYYTVTDGSGGYEVGVGTYSAGTIARTRIILSSNSNAAVNWTNGAKNIALVIASEAIGPDLTIFTGNGTWTPREGSTFYIAECYGAGGGGGGGRRSNATGTAAGGGGGGGGGGYAIIQGRISDISTPVTITVGTAGTAGSGSAAGATSGTNGGNGGSSSFGTYAVGYGGGFGSGATTTTGAVGGGTAGFLTSANGQTAGTGGGATGGAANTAGADTSHYYQGGPGGGGGH